MSEHVKCYGIQRTSDTTLIYHRGFVYCSYFSFLHITIKGKILELKYYYDLKDLVEQIINKYNLHFLKKHRDVYIDKNII